MFFGSGNLVWFSLAKTTHQIKTRLSGAMGIVFHKEGYRYNHFGLFSEMVSPFGLTVQTFDHQHRCTDVFRNCFCLNIPIGEITIFSNGLCPHQKYYFLLWSRFCHRWKSATWIDRVWIQTIATLCKLESPRSLINLRFPEAFVP